MPHQLRIVKVEYFPGHGGNVFNATNGRRRRSHHLPSFSQSDVKSSFIASVTDVSHSLLATNGPLHMASNRGSPAPLGPPVPNGKPTSPFGERTNPMSSSAQIAAQTVSSKDPKAAAQAASDMRNVVRRKLTGYVGFANLPNQWHRKSVRKGFNFNVMVVGKASACTEGVDANR